MIDLDASIATYTAATLVFAATPGQSTAVVIQQTVDNGWRAGFAAALGCAVANATHATAARLGLALLVARAPAALDVIRVLGGAYLLWLGGKSLWRAWRPAPLAASTTVAGAAAFGQGLVTNLLNPSILTFYVVIVPSFLGPAGATSRYLLLSAIHVTLAFACHNTWSGLFNQIGHLMRSPRARRVFDALAGAALIGLAIRLV
jgi:threonine/homoserine/homoserine lactone efflux protein